jgi:2'-5' RNA ligase
MIEDKFIRLNTVFKPSTEVVEEAITLSEEIGKSNESFFILDNIQFHPHITIYSPEYPIQNLKEVLKTVEEIAKNQEKIEFTFKELGIVEDFIAIFFNVSPEVKSLHKKIVTRLNPLREGHLRDKYLPSSEHYSSFSQKQLENIQKYGYPNVMDLYHLHLTITCLKDKSLAEKIVNSLSWKINHLFIDKLAVYTMGHSGTCKELVKEFILK